MSRIPQLLTYLKENPTDPFLQYALALEHVKAGAYEEGLHYFELLVRDHPDYIGTYYHLAKLYAKLDRREDATACYNNGISVARKLNDQHALAELQNAALNHSMGLDDEDD